MNLSNDRPPSLREIYLAQENSKDEDKAEPVEKDKDEKDKEDEEDEVRSKGRKKTVSKSKKDD